MAWWIPVLKAIGTYAASSGTKTGNALGSLVNITTNSAKTAQNKAENNGASTH